uniref:2,5-diamino-6-(ribosylamino)-4(3H)-pyrimidinone 5'-phosphate reductase n=1 Tax=Candidatus Methanogaster sp. ANME-2c ERB4 TaxID=2759911 RepID=A0A7G9YE19_9EURY|nr:2,5-diamino-6-ribosylamino-4(3H)-pyrimidinone 5'-phosphate reductase [Methanosarcinales archaeon ANME-2c ERB4]QNO44909.1 2,5-diamino-6-ribosylamino-4(3H)-pyrimidinone 5'-phosphate reductase [Methanosarcinales archaeon ANME-2c ERB4]QNO46253.1 2,5-diamino-6-ribosylamino-4(3H)-pyrimidinone 5'-phosphate reductase [Methanosarcinales archaeon ANME-2c ERB4]
MRPHVFINAAMSADGKISAHTREQIPISGKVDFQRVDRLKYGVDAIMVGIGTVLSDDPSLTVKSEKFRKERRDMGKDENPTRIVADSLARTPVDADILMSGAGRRIILVSESAPDVRLDRLREAGAEIVVTGEHRVDLASALEHLYEMGVCRLMVEGGGSLNWSLLSHGLVDTVYVYVGNMILGGESSPTLADGTGFSGIDGACQLELISLEQMDRGFVVEWQVK